MNVRLLTCSLLTVSAMSIADAVHLQAKAMIAQRLIERAWVATLANHTVTRPWHWADTWPVARLRTASRRQDLFVLAGANGGSLAFGPGHFTNTALPGERGTSVVAGHRDTHFEFLEQIDVGDMIEVQGMSGEWVSFEVQSRQIVDTRQSDVWATAPARDELHLLTCFPFDAVAPGGPLRLIVIAARV